MKGLTHTEARARRKEVAFFYEAQGLKATLKTFGCSGAHIREACAEAGIAFSVKTSTTDTVFKVMQHLRAGQFTHSEIACKLCVTRQYVEWVLKRCLQYGIL